MTYYDSLLGEILDRAPSSETLCLVLTELKRTGHTRKVIQECIRVLRHHPENPSLRLILAEAYFEEGLLSQAEAEIETAVSQMDRYASAYLLRAEIYRTLKRNDEAVHSLKTYLAHRPQDETALDLLREMETPEVVPRPEAAQVQEEIIEPAAVEALEPPAPAAMESSALGSEKPGPLLEEDALSEIATPTLAEVYVNQGQIREAVSIYEKLLAQNPGDHASVQRIQELNAMQGVASPRPEDKQEGPRANRNKQKTIAVLESWLANIRKMSEDTLSA